ncbi:MAG: GatB/YqeY domain-containing protein, partial [Pseudomonadota bacterium]
RLLKALETAESSDTAGTEAQTLRLVKCAMSDRDVMARGRGDCNGCIDTELVDLLETMVAQREVSAAEYDEAGRIADAERERQEIEVLAAFLPKPLSGDALDSAVQDVIGDLEASKLKDVGRCMSALRERFPGRIECSSAGKAVREALS